ncbi:MAG: hypothetical protein ACO2PM_16135 [Pyrobaculum sp.]
MANPRLAAYLLAAALAATLAAVEPPPDAVAVLVEVDLEIPPLAYYDGREFRPVHVAYVGEWDMAYWVEANAPAHIPTWNFKKAVIYLPREALNAKTPPDAKGGILRIYLNQTAVELVEAPPEVVATYSYHKPDETTAPKTKAQWIKPPTKKPLNKDLRGGEDRQSSSHQPPGKEESLHQSTQSTTVVFPSGAFIYRQYTGWINANGEICLNVLMPDAYIMLRNPSVASVGYNATRVWRTAWYVYTNSYGRGVVVGRGVVKVWAVDPAYLDKKMLLGQWTADLRNGYVTYTTSIPLSWPEFVGLELCFVPYYSASYVVGANATLGFRKNAIPAAGGTYLLGISPVDRSQNVGGVVQHLKPPVRNLMFGPFSLVDGYYGEELSIDMTVYVPWRTPPCPTLTVTTYTGEFGHVHLDSASFTASSYNNGLCAYEVRRSVTLSPDAVGLWYDEARARDKAVAIKVSFSHPVSEVKIYRVDISGRRFAENYIDKNVDQWQLLILRGFFSQTLRACTATRLPQVNYTVALINVATYSVVGADFLAVESPSDYGIKGVRFRVKLVGASPGLVNVYVKGDRFEGLRPPPVNIYIKWDSVEGGEGFWWLPINARVRWGIFEEPWWTAWAFGVSQVLKAVLDFFGLISGPVGWFMDRVFDLRDLLYPAMTMTNTKEYVDVYWRSGIYDKFYQAAFRTGGSTRDRVVEVVDVRVGTDSTHLCMSSPITSPMPAVVTKDPLFDPQFLRHWVFGMRVTVGVAFRER